MRKLSTARPTRTETALASIKQAILRGEIEEGAFLVEADIRARYHLGRTPYREACNRLHHEGLLQVVPRRGYYIPEISFQGACDLFEVRVILEDAIAELAATRATDRDILQLRRLAAHPPPAGPPASFAALIQANAEFHLLLAASTRNRLLVDLLKRNLESTERLMYVELRSRRFSANDFRTLHLPIVEALEAHDPARTRAAVFADISDAQRSSLSFRGTAPAPPGRRAAK